MKGHINAPRGGNELFPIFLKLNQLQVLLVGAGNVGLEKLEAILGNSPDTQVKIVAAEIRSEIVELAGIYPSISLHQKEFQLEDLDHIDLAVVATGDNTLNEQIRQNCRERRILINVADKPDLCDFYLGSIVKKGDLKIAISTNGKSPTMAKRLKETLNNYLPDEINDSLQQLSMIRNKLGGDFKYKVRELNKLTSRLIDESGKPKQKGFSARIAKLLGLKIAGFWIVLIATILISCQLGFGFLSLFN